MYLKYIPLIPKVGSIECLSWSMVLGYIAKNIMKYTWYQSWKVEIKPISLWEQGDPDTRRDGGHFKSNKTTVQRREQKPGIPQKLRFTDGLFYDDMDVNNCFLSKRVMKRSRSSFGLIYFFTMEWNTKQSEYVSNIFPDNWLAWFLLFLIMLNISIWLHYFYILFCMHN